VLVESMPWARCKARFTRDFKEWVVCLALRAQRRRGARAWSGIRSARYVRVCADLEAARGRGLRGCKAHRDR
jgi:hypothetical protein